MSNNVANIKHWSGANILLDVSAPELGIATLDVNHNDIKLSLSIALDQSQLIALRDGVNKALALINSSKSIG